MRVVVTGASGRIGATFVRAADRSWFDLLRTDLHDADPKSAHPFAALDITDPAACRAACNGADAVLHLAADPSPDADFRSSVLPLNIVGTFNVVEAAVAAGVGRVVVASSAQAVAGYPIDHQTREVDAPWPANDYGAGKAFGEALCAAASSRGATSFVSLRIGYFAEQRPGPEATLRDRMAWLAPDDAVQLLTLALTVPLSGHHVANGISDNAAKQLSLTATRRLLGYRPTADAFATDDEVSDRS